MVFLPPTRNTNLTRFGCPSPAFRAGFDSLIHGFIGTFVSKRGQKFNYQIQKMVQKPAPAFFFVNVSVTAFSKFKDEVTAVEGCGSRRSPAFPPTNRSAARKAAVSRTARPATLFIKLFAKAVDDAVGENWGSPSASAHSTQRAAANSFHCRHQPCSGRRARRFQADAVVWRDRQQA